MNKFKLIFILLFFGSAIIFLRRFIAPSYGKFVVLIICILGITYGVYRLRTLNVADKISPIGNIKFNKFMFYAVEVLKLFLFFVYLLYFGWNYV